MKSFLKKSALCSASCLQALSVAGIGVGAIALAAPAAAQDYTRGGLSGTVVDEAGAPVAGAQVTIRSNEQGFSQTAVTNASGSFTVQSLPTGTYTVMVSADGTPIVEDRGATVLAGQTNSYRYIAGAAPVDAGVEGEGIVVLGTRIQVNDFAATQTGLTIDVAELAETVPVSRDQTSLILLAPGTTSGDAGFGNLASVGGATVAENAYYVNGLNITDFRSGLGGAGVPFEFYRTLDVKTGGYAPEFGRALGGVTSAVTKSGSNDFKAGVVALWSPDKLREDAPNTGNAYNETDYAESWEANLYVSGPIIKDRLFFYALYNPGKVTTENSSRTTRLRTRSENDSPFFGGKIDFVIADGHRLEGTYFRDESTTDLTYVSFNPITNAVGGTSVVLGNNVPVAHQSVTTGGDNWIVSYTGQFTDWFTLSASYGEYNNQYVNTLDPANSAYVATRVNTPSSFRVGGFAGSYFNQKDKRKAYRVDADVYADFAGEHHFRGGFDMEDMDAAENTYYSDGGYYYILYNSYILRYQYSADGAFNTKQSAFYLQDSWTLPGDRINLQLGVRADRFKNYNAGGDKFYDSDWSWGPRLGASFDVLGDGSTKLNAFWGRYYLPVATNTNIRLAGNEAYYIQGFRYPTGTVFTDANGDNVWDNTQFDANGAPVVGTNFLPFLPCPAASQNAGESCYTIYGNGTVKDSSVTVAQGLKPSYSDEWIVGLTHRTGDWTFGLSYTNRRLGETLEDSAIDAAAIDYCMDAGGYAYTTCYYVWTGYHQYVLSNPGKPVTVTLDNCNADTGVCVTLPELTRTFNPDELGYPKAQRNYDAVQFTVDKAFNGLYSFNFSYTWTHLRGNFEGGVKSDNNQTDTGLTQDFDQPGFLEGAYGRLANEREHSFKLYGYVEPTDWLSIGVNALLESPRHFSCIGTYRNDNSTFEYYYGAASYWCMQSQFGGSGSSDGTHAGDGTGSVLVPRGSAFKSEWNKRVDLSVSFKPFENQFPGTRLTVDVFNLFNWKSKLDYDEFGDTYRVGANVDDPATPYTEGYGSVLGYQAPRSVRFTLAMRYGGN